MPYPLGDGIFASIGDAGLSIPEYCAANPAACTLSNSSDVGVFTAAAILILHELPLPEELAGRLTSIADLLQLAQLRVDIGRENGRDTRLEEVLIRDAKQQLSLGHASVATNAAGPLSAILPPPRAAGAAGAARNAVVGLGASTVFAEGTGIGPGSQSAGISAIEDAKATLRRVARRPIRGVKR